MDHGDLARQMFYKGYNCSQAVVTAFHKELAMTEAEAARLSSSFGGGMGRMRETCGAVSGMLLVAGFLWGYDAPGDDKAKAEHYRLVQRLAGKFRERAGSIVCQELLGNPPSDPAPTPRTADFYKTRPCADFVALAGEILDQELEKRAASHTRL